MKKQRNILKIIAIVMGIVIIYALVYLLVNLAFIVFFTAGFNDRYDITTDTSKYMDVIGVNAKNEYQDKWGMKEDIFPENINNLDVSDFKMVYYNPWDKQFLAYMVVNYDAGAYQEEMNRLKNYKSTDYLGYYGVTGFNNYNLLAVEADSYQGFVYAITPGNNQIIYVELIFCNYFMDIKYKELIPNEYLPDNFDATVNNKYRKTMLK